MLQRVERLERQWGVAGCGWGVICGVRVREIRLKGRLGSVVDWHGGRCEGGLEWIPSPPTFATEKTHRGTRKRGGESRSDKTKQELQVNCLSVSVSLSLSGRVAWLLLQSEVPEVESNTRSEYAGVLETVFQTLYGLGPVRTFYITKNLLLDMGRAKAFVHFGRLESIKVRN